MDSKETSQTDVTGQPIPNPVGLRKIHWFQLVNALDTLLDLHVKHAYADHVPLTRVETLLDKGIVLAWNVKFQEGWEHSEMMRSYPNAMMRLAGLVNWWDQQLQYNATDEVWALSVDDFRNTLAEANRLIAEIAA